MAKQDSNLGSAWWAKNLDDVDNEIARLSIACNVRILDPGVIERVLNNDASVCGSRNPAGFEKLRTALKMHYHIRGQTATMPLHVEILYNEYNFVAAFAVASLLALFALVTLAVKTFLEAQFADELAAQRWR